MKNLLFIFLIANNLAFSQSITILPNLGIETNQNQFKIINNAEQIGLQQSSGLIKVGTIVTNARAIYSTLSNAPLYFSTNLQPVQMNITSSQNVSIGNGIISQKLNVNGNVKLDSMASIYDMNRPVYVDNLGTIKDYKTQYYAMPRSAFKPSTNSELSTNTPVNFSQEGGIYFPASVNGREKFNATVKVPIGSTITGYEFYYIDNSTVSDLSFSFVRKEFGDSSALLFIISSTNGASSGVNMISNYNLNIKALPNYTYEISIFSYDGIKNKWDGVNTQVVGVKLIYK